MLLPKSKIPFEPKLVPDVENNETDVSSDEDSPDVSILHLVLLLFIVIGFGLIYWKVDTDARSIRSDIGIVQTDLHVGSLLNNTYEKEKLEIDTPINTEPFSYSSAAALIATVLQDDKAFDYTVADLESMADGCGTEYSENYFSDLVAKFEDTQKTVYSFKYKGDSQSSDTYHVTLLPNKAGYKTLDSFKNDFDECYAGGNAYPIMLNDNWLLFTSSCGSGFDDGSGRPNGCQEISDVIESTISL